MFFKAGNRIICDEMIQEVRYWDSEYRIIKIIFEDGHSIESQNEDYINDVVDHFKEHYNLDLTE